MSEKRTRHVTVRFNHTEYAALVTKARVTGISVSALLRAHANRAQVVPTLRGNANLALFWARIATMLAVVAERSRAIADKEVALAVVAQLVVVESQFTERQRKVPDV
jgi:predicted acetyltransferase